MEAPSWKSNYNFGPCTFFYGQQNPRKFPSPTSNPSTHQCFTSSGKPATLSAHLVSQPSASVVLLPMHSVQRKFAMKNKSSVELTGHVYRVLFVKFHVKKINSINAIFGRQVKKSALFNNTKQKNPSNFIYFSQYCPFPLRNIYGCQNWPAENYPHNFAKHIFLS